MNVADEVQEKLEGHDLFFGVGGRICQLCRELFDLVDHAISGRTVGCSGPRWDGRMIEARRIEVGRGDLDIDEVPLAHFFLSPPLFSSVNFTPHLTPLAL